MTRERAGRGRRVLLVAGLVVFLPLLAAFAWLAWSLSASRPIVEGRIELSGLNASVTVARDRLGVPTVSGASREDVALATGFVHAQERFFQMDLLRRLAAGTLAELLGPAAVSADRGARLHRFPDHARRSLEEMDEEGARLVALYARGVNAGLERLGAVPPEYLLLRSRPAPWRPEDTLLVIHAMYLTLQGGWAAREDALGAMRDHLDEESFRFLAAPGTVWDAPLEGGAMPPAGVPEAVARSLAAGDSAPAWDGEEPSPGSNAWAVAGAHSSHGGALLANDMHLPHALPNFWFRMSLEWTEAEGDERHRVVGVTLPGAPIVVAGSNGKIAWGFSNAYGDFGDLIELSRDDPVVTMRMETFEARGAEPVEWGYPQSPWGPVRGGASGRLVTLHWVAYHSRATNPSLRHLERAESVDEALAVAPSVGIPAQNLVVADAEGRIGWTIAGPLPARGACADARVPQADPESPCVWSGFVAPSDYPRVVDPPSGRIWTANGRLVGGRGHELIGDGGHALGARQGAIRDRLLATERASESDMLAIQLDDRVPLLEGWKELLEEIARRELDVGDLERADALEEIERTLAEWTGRAALDSASYRLVREFRDEVFGRVSSALFEPVTRQVPEWRVRGLRQLEGAVWGVIGDEADRLPAGWIERREEMLREAALDVHARLTEGGAPLDEATWGARNGVAVQHPLSRALPALSRVLDAPLVPLPGDLHAPRVQTPRFGASMRMVVSPGREELGLFHMPGGQSGHFLQGGYLAGHRSWATGEPTPFLPGPAVSTLELAPAPSE